MISLSKKRQTDSISASISALNVSVQAQILELR